MAQERHLQVILEDQRRLRKFHEGWVGVLVRPERGIQKLIDRWMVLRGIALFLFDGNTEESSRNLVDAILLKPIFRVDNMVPGFNQQGFGLEIESLTTSGQKKFTSFLFRQQNDRDYWRACIVGLTQGFIPKDVNLLPGQSAHIQEVISQSVEFPPQLGYPQTPRRGHSSIVQTQDNLGSCQPWHQPSASKGKQWNENDSVEVLLNRQKILSQGMLENESPSMESGAWKTPPTGKTLTRSLSSIPPGLDKQFLLRQSSVDAGFHSVRTPKNQGSALPHGQENWIYVNRDKVYPFYENSAMNGKCPTWFVECSRDIAETVLTVGRRYGNVLMRPCAGNALSFAISYRDENTTPGVSRVSHYSVTQRPEGFKIDVDDQHAPMLCLQDVLEYFVKFVGHGTQPFSCNDLNEILGPQKPDNDSTRSENKDTLANFQNDLQAKLPKF